MTTTYAAFLEQKRRSVAPIGRGINAAAVHPMLHAWQSRIVQWACERGRAAIWADTGLGKTFMQIEWARLIADRALIVAPLAVCQQTIREGAKLGVPITYARREDDAAPTGITITNYEMARYFNADQFGAVVLDEASILKQSEGKTRNALIEQFSVTPYRLACTATPAPNDVEELTSQAQFIGVTTRNEMLAAYFIHDQDGWRLKGHARTPMYRWMASWAVALRHPRDLGYETPGYDLPGLAIHSVVVDVDHAPDGQLFATNLGGVGGRAEIRRVTLDARVAAAAELYQREPDEAWIYWCGLNAEAEAIATAIPGAVNVPGSWTPEQKAEALLAFSDGSIRVLVTKPSIAAFGLNWQHCARVCFVGLSDSYEAYYQAIRRCYRFGQTRHVDAYVVVSGLETQIAENVSRKEHEADQIHKQLVHEMQTAGELHA